MHDLFSASLAWGQDSSNQPGNAGILGGLLSGPLPMLVLMFAIFYFLLIRPQQKKAKAHKTMLANLHKGDDIITSGGIYGKIINLTEQAVIIEIAPQIRIKVARGYITGLLSSPEPIAAQQKNS